MSIDPPPLYKSSERQLRAARKRGSEAPKQPRDVPDDEPPPPTRLQQLRLQVSEARRLHLEQERLRSLTEIGVVKVTNNRYESTCGACGHVTHAKTIRDTRGKMVDHVATKHVSQS